MNTQEGTDLSKGGVALLMAVIAISSIASLFFFLNTRTNNYMARQIDAKNTSLSTALRELSYEDQVPVQSVYSTLTQIKDPELEFIAIVTSNTGSPTVNVYTYQYENESETSQRLTKLKDDLNNTVLNGISQRYKPSGRYVEDACAYLHKNITKYAKVYYTAKEVDNTTNTVLPAYLVIVIDPNKVVGAGT